MTAPAAGRLDRLRRRPALATAGVPLMLVLTFVTGIVDAVGYLALDRVFTGNMTGNVVILAMAVTRADGLPVVGPLIALLTFTLGAIVAGRVLRHREKGWTTPITALLAIGSAVIASVSVLVGVAGGRAGVQVTAAALIASAMGVQAAIARKVAITDMTTVVVTSTLTSWASETLHLGQRRWWNRRTGALLILFLGAGVGALLLRLTPVVPLALAAVLTAAVAAVGHRTQQTPPVTGRNGA